MNLKARTYKLEPISGFTLIEIMVAISIFTIVAVITTGALVAASDVNRKAQAIKIAMDNVSFAMDSMVTNLREGGEYFCGTTRRGGTPCDDNDGIVFTSTRLGSKKYVGYRLQGDSIRTASGDSNSLSQYISLTSPEVKITKLSFYIPEIESPLTPRVTIVVEGQVPGKTITNFYLQTTVKKI